MSVHACVRLALAMVVLGIPRGAWGQTLDERMAWWRESRLGMFIHWGLYAIPAGEWNGETHHGEWIRTSARIPREEYVALRARFNPVAFDADAWVRAAKGAGMHYIVITSKHHDGFGLFDSAHTDHDVMDTPFRRDILKELAEACRREGIRLCLYYSIMDWHHDDYLPRREWETTRPTDGADFSRYVGFMKDQIRELLTAYGDIGILWFDGQWEGTWSNELGADLEAHVRALQPRIIINSRVGRGGGPYGTDEGRMGDYATPEQFIPGVNPGLDWETCMTMNGHWGYNRADLNYKPASDLIRMLADIASKGGNYLLNVGPTAEGTFPPEALDRLAALGRWMAVNEASIRGTEGTPFGPLPWGRVTQRRLDSGDTRLYLHVFEWPANGRITLPGLLNAPRGATLMANGAPVRVTRQGADLWLLVPREAPDSADSVIVLDVRGEPDHSLPPRIEAFAPIFVDALDVHLSTDQPGVSLRYTLDGSDPSPVSPAATGPIRLSSTAEVRAAAFRGARVVSPIAAARFERVIPRPAVQTLVAPRDGLAYAAYEGDWNALPDFASIEPVGEGVVPSPTLDAKPREEHFAMRFTGFLEIPRDGVYLLTLESDDGSRLRLGNEIVIDNDGLHSLLARREAVALSAGLHPITIEFFEKSGGDELNVYWEAGNLPRSRIPPNAWKH